MNNISFIKKDLFKDFKEVDERVNINNIYIASLEGDFKDINALKFNPEFQNELFKVLSKDVLTLGYLCNCCNAYMSGYPNSLCTLCDEYYLEQMGIKKAKGLCNKGLNKYYLFQMEHKLTIAFTTQSELDIECIINTFKPMKYIKNICITKTDDESVLEGNENVAIYNEMVIVDKCY